MTTKIAGIKGSSSRLGEKVMLARKGALLLVVAIGLTGTTFGQTLWTTDKYHSQLHFSVLHFGINRVEGAFREFTVTMTSEKEDFSDAQVEMVAQVRSIDTQIEIRDNDMKSRKWFNADEFPAITFKSTSFKKVKGKDYELQGNITLHGVTVPIAFHVVFNGWAVTMTKKKTAGFTVTGKVKRSDFNLGDPSLETGVGNEINVWANVELGKN